MQLHHLGYVGLDKEDALSGVKPDCQPVEYHLVDVALELAGVCHRGQGVNVNGAVDAVLLVLEPHPVLDGSQVVAYMLTTRGAGSGKDAAFFHSYSGVKFSINSEAITN